LYGQAQELAALKERQRLARDLHDAVSQTLYSANTIAESLPRLWERQPERTLELLEQLRLLNKGAMAEMRTLLWELRPEALERTPLDELISQLVDAFRGRTKMQITLTCEMENREPLPNEVHTAFYRVAQEALGNIIKHSQANEADVVFSSRLENVKLAISDDGKGFDTKRTSGGLGMGTMRERAEGIQATLHIASTVGQGTRVTISWQREVTLDTAVTESSAL
jgi:two-component system nitrate/nitrite sensor histidine kinase NarX